VRRLDPVLHQLRPFLRQLRLTSAVSLVAPQAASSSWSKCSSNPLSAISPTG
jgi:hypothetical protein